MKLAVVLQMPDGKRVEIEAAEGGSLYVDVEQDCMCKENYSVPWSDLSSEYKQMAGKLIDEVARRACFFEKNPK
ncbi:hypothetical protein [Oleidesulfovibrio sp.]|uniref:hypothetical protein n=1 Tax=Oleidesulfovibrio sp. TaxID=2909707 RepID=UPI003A88090E